MADATTPPAQSAATGASAGLTVPPEVEKKYPDLIRLIRSSESMNDEERQYWINILPIMTAEQVKNLNDILDNERKQLAAIDAKYQTEVSKIGNAELVRKTEEERKKRRAERSYTEATHREQEDKAAEDLLKKMEDAK